MGIANTLNENAHRNVLFHQVFVFPAGAAIQEEGRVAIVSFIEHQEPVQHYSTTLLDLPYQETLRRRRDARGPGVTMMPEQGIHLC